MAASDYFLKIDGIKGESQDDKHRGEIEIDSFSWGLSQTAARGVGGGGGAGKVVFQDFHFSKPCDAASPSLFLGCASGQHIKETTLVLRKAGDRPVEYLKITLSDCIVSSFQQSGGGDLPSESFSLNFAKIQYEYKFETAEGKYETIKAGWGLKANKKV